MNKNILIAVLSAGMMMISAEGMAQRNNRPANNSSSAQQKQNNTQAAASQTQNRQNSQPAASAPKAGSNAKPSNDAKQNTPSAPMHQKGQRAQTATDNKNLPPKQVAPSDNYKKMPSRGAEVSKHKATGSAQVVRHNNKDFYYKKGVFYRYENNKYVVSRAPIGARVASIPTPRVILLNSVRYYYYYGVYYVQTPNYEYEVVQAPVGAVVESIPEGYEKLIINGETYYIVDDVQYKAVVYDGEIWYEVIKIMD